MVHRSLTGPSLVTEHVLARLSDMLVIRTRSALICMVLEVGLTVYVKTVSLVMAKLARLHPDRPLLLQLTCVLEVSKRLCEVHVFLSPVAKANVSKQGIERSLMNASALAVTSD